jgi:hypothetical protein
MTRDWGAWQKCSKPRKHKRKRRRRRRRNDKMWRKCRV